MTEQGAEEPVFIRASIARLDFSVVEELMRQFVVSELAAFMESEGYQVEMWDAQLVEAMMEDLPTVRSFRLGSYHEKSRIWHQCYTALVAGL